MKRILLIILTLSLCLTVLSGCTPKQFKNLNGSDIKSVSISTLPEFYGYEYSFTGDDAREIVDYLSALSLTPRLISIGKGGMTWVISIEYESGSETTVYIFGDEIWINDGAKYVMQPEETGVFEAMLEALNQKRQ